MRLTGAMIIVKWNGEARLATFHDDDPTDKPVVAIPVADLAEAQKLLAALDPTGTPAKSPARKKRKESSPADTTATTTPGDRAPPAGDENKTRPAPVVAAPPPPPGGTTVGGREGPKLQAAPKCIATGCAFDADTNADVCRDHAMATEGEKGRWRALKAEAEKPTAPKVAAEKARSIRKSVEGAEPKTEPGKVA